MFFSGFLINILNPAVFLFWFAWTAAVHADADTTANPAQYQFIVFSTCLLFVLLTDLMKVFMAAKLRKQLTPKVLKIINKISGLILIGFGITLIGGVFFWGTSAH
jgi:threonine/homoserine/homoserine lactone efflux protein